MRCRPRDRIRMVLVLMRAVEEIDIERPEEAQVHVAVVLVQERDAGILRMRHAEMDEELRRRSAELCEVIDGQRGDAVVAQYRAAQARAGPAADLELAPVRQP